MLVRVLFMLVCVVVDIFRLVVIIRVVVLVNFNMVKFLLDVFMYVVVCLFVEVIKVF